MAKRMRQGTFTLPEATGDNTNSPFLETSDVGKLGAKATMHILGVRPDTVSKFGAGVNIHVRIGKAEYDWTQRINTPNYRTLLDTFGPNPEKWIGVVKGEVARSAKWKKDYLSIVG